ncbi:helix-turn-helix domain-containing protein [Sulfurimonas sp.]|uniref:helix-turn-helix domain-containing protein n=1 Tax=Sulfurimonas sp. TaxID=2022749 RepID=UPI003D0BA719
MEKQLSDVSNKEVMSFYKKIGENVKEARISANISQLDLALAIGIKSVAFYSNCESVRYNKHFNLEHIYKISKVLNISISSLIEG